MARRTRGLKFFRTARWHNGRAMFRSECVKCGGNAFGLMTDSSLREWEGKHCCGEPGAVAPKRVPQIT